MLDLDELRASPAGRLQRLAVVALDYDQCLAQGRADVNVYLRERWGVSEAQAREWIRAARRAGLLVGGTSPGRAAGALDWTRYQEIMNPAGVGYMFARPAVRTGD
jgi:hypothetical protein